ncbi:hypothetical protein ACIRP7_37355 [Streptomyces sp. NPDC102270]
MTVTVSALLIALVALVRKLGGQRDGQRVLPAPTSKLPVKDPT